MDRAFTINYQNLNICKHVFQQLFHICMQLVCMKETSPKCRSREPRWGQFKHVSFRNPIHETGQQICVLPPFCLLHCSLLNLYYVLSFKRNHIFLSSRRKIIEVWDIAYMQYKCSCFWRHICFLLFHHMTSLSRQQVCNLTHTHLPKPLTDLGYQSRS